MVERLRLLAAISSPIRNFLSTPVIGAQLNAVQCALQFFGIILGPLGA
jgi:hypothetical protein